MKHIDPRIALLVVAIPLTACVSPPLGPTIPVMPGANKSFDVFAADQATCQQYAANQTAPAVAAANNQAVGTALLSSALGAGLGAGIGAAAGNAGKGAAIGAASGAIGGALSDVGINDRFMKEAAQTLQSGNAALFLLIRKMTTDKVLTALQGEGGTVLRTSFDHTKEEALRAALAGATQSVAQPAGG